MKILITGINGFIGQHLGRELLKRGHIVSGLGRNKICKVDHVAVYHEGTVLNKDIVEKAMYDVETVVHLAALTSHHDIVAQKFETLETNFLGTKNVLDAFTKTKTAKKFLYSSTGKVYGKIIHLPISETHPTNPINILGKSKLITERLIDFYNDNQKEMIIFRIFNSYGPFQSANFLVPTILSQLKNGSTEIVLGDMEAKRDYVYIDDIVSAFVRGIEKEGPPGISVYNICTNIGSSTQDIVTLIGKIKGVEIKVRKNPELLRSDEMKDEYGSFELVKKTFGWEPKYSLKEGLQQSIA